MKRLKRFKKNLRINQTQAEHRLWWHLRNRQFMGLKFRRQHILHGYIVDFVCIEKKLIIEIDGGQHADAKAKDDARTAKLESFGYRIIRFWNNDVLRNTEGVLSMIEDLFHPHPPFGRPLPQAGEVDY
jgi:very-short-patch-repair endonuclease